MQIDNKIFRSGCVIPMVAVLSNIKSTTNALDMEKVRQITCSVPNVVHHEISSVDQIDGALALFARTTPSLLVINGGDGTVGAVLGALLYRNPFGVIPPIAVMPGGKTNMTAADLGYKGHPEHVLRKLLTLTIQGNIQNHLTQRNLIELDMKDGDSPKVGTFFGAASVVNSIKWTRKNVYGKNLPNVITHPWAVFMLLMAFMGYIKNRHITQSHNLEISMCDGNFFKGDYSIVMATTLDKLIVGLKPYKVEDVGGLRFSAIESGYANARRAVAALITRRWGSHPVEGLHVQHSNEIRMRGHAPVTLDGEIFFPSASGEFILRGDRKLTFVGL